MAGQLLRSDAGVLHAALTCRRLLGRAAADADGGPAAELEAIGGAEPGQTLFDATASGRFDLLVMGTRGLGRFGRTLLGSVSAHVAARSPIPVLIAHDTD